MRCEEFRHRLMVDPYSRDADFRAHAGRCRACAEALREAMAFESALHAALEVQTRAAEEAGGTRRGHRAIPNVAVAGALAFLVVAAAAISFLSFGPAERERASDWEQVVIGHIRAEEDHLQETGEVALTSLQLLFRGLGLEIESTVPARWAGRCDIGGRDGLHLVLGGERGPVTALFMPGKAVRRPLRIATGRFDGVVLPAAFGNLAVVGERGEPLAPVAERLLRALR